MLQPVAHAWIDADEDVRKAMGSLTAEQLGVRPGGAASAAFHVKHAMGSLERLLTYARGESLSETQLATHAGEKTLDTSALTPDQLAQEFSAAIAKAFEQLRNTNESELFEVRLVGRARVPSNTLGLLVHAAEHTARHIGQLMTTAKIVGG